jgi:hypothetical protein
MYLLTRSDRTSNKQNRRATCLYVCPSAHALPCTNEQRSSNSNASYEKVKAPANRSIERVEQSNQSIEDQCEIELACSIYNEARDPNPTSNDNAGVGIRPSDLHTAGNRWQGQGQGRQAEAGRLRRTIGFDSEDNSQTARLKSLG